MRSSTSIDIGSAFDAIEKLDVSQEIKDHLMSMTLVDKEIIRNEIKEEILSQQDFDVNVVEGFRPEGFVLSDQVMELGCGNHKMIIPIRELMQHDIDCLVPLIPDFVGHFLKIRSPEKLKNVSIWSVVENILKIGLRDRRNNHYTEYAVMLYEELARLFSSDDYKITATWLISYCRPAQIINAVKKLYQVNVLFFVELWGEFPSSMRNQMSIVIGELTKATKPLKENVKTLWTEVIKSINSIGGTPFGGNSTGESLSIQNADSHTEKSVNLLSVKSGKRNKPSVDGEILKDITIGNTEKITTPKQDQKKQKTLSRK